jgi:glutamine cyclotransferase
MKVANGKSPHSISRVIQQEDISGSRCRQTDLSEHVVYLTWRDAVAFKVDKPDLLESIHNFVFRLPLF